MRIVLRDGRGIRWLPTDWGVDYPSPTDLAVLTQAAHDHGIEIEFLDRYRWGPGHSDDGNGQRAATLREFYTPPRPPMNPIQIAWSTYRSMVTTIVALVMLIVLANHFG
jgi:hypothetical protein